MHTSKYVYTGSTVCLMHFIILTQLFNVLNFGIYFEVLGFVKVQMECCCQLIGFGMTSNGRVCLFKFLFTFL